MIKVLKYSSSANWFSFCIIIFFILYNWFSVKTRWVWSIFSCFLISQELFFLNPSTYFDSFIACCFSLLRFWSGMCSFAPVMFIFPLPPKLCQICDSCHFPEGSVSNLPRACRRDISPTLSFDWVFFTALSFREATSTSTSCQALPLNHVISQKQWKNSRITRQRTSPWIVGGQLKTIAHNIWLRLFPWVLYIMWLEWETVWGYWLLVCS